MKNFVMNKDSQKPKIKSKKKEDEKEEEEEEEEPKDPMFEISGEYTKIEVKFDNHMDDSVKSGKSPKGSPRRARSNSNRSGKVLASVTAAPRKEKQMLVESSHEVAVFQKIFEDLGLEEFGNADREFYRFKEIKKAADVATLNAIKGKTIVELDDSVVAEMVMPFNFYNMGGIG